MNTVVKIETADKIRSKKLIKRKTNNELRSANLVSLMAGVKTFNSSSRVFVFIMLIICYRPLNIKNIPPVIRLGMINGIKIQNI